MRPVLLIAVALFAALPGTLAAKNHQPVMNKKQALIIVDVQNDYFSGGKMELSGSAQAADNIARALTHCREKGIPVIHVQHIATAPDATFFLPQTEGAKIHEKVLPRAGEELIVKHYPNSFRETNLLEYLRGQGITDLVVSGMMTHVCIDATVKAAKDYGFNCTVLSDGCATRDVEVVGKKVNADAVQHALLAAMAFYYATVETTDTWLGAQR